MARNKKRRTIVRNKLPHVCLRHLSRGGLGPSRPKSQALIEVQKLLQHTQCSSAGGVALPLGAIEELEGRDGVIHHHGSGQLQEIRKELERKRLMSI